MYDMCYVCFGNKQLIKCGTCVYRICQHCILSERMYTLKVFLCRHDECAYEYLTDEERENMNCYVCSKRTIEVSYKCGTCGGIMVVTLEMLLDAIIDKIRGDGKFEMKCTNIDHVLIFYTIRDIDCDSLECVYFWEVRSPTWIA